MSDGPQRFSGEVWRIHEFGTPDVMKLEEVEVSTPETDEVIVHACDLDATRFGKETIFDFQRHRRPEHYARITAQVGVELPKER